MLGPDHVVHAVRDLDAAGELYRRAGFTIGGRNVHPWGTHNRVIQFRDVYIELLTVADPSRMVPASSRKFSFGEFHQHLLAQREGLSMLLLKSRDAMCDAVRFRQKSIGDFDTFEFARSGIGPDGAEVKLAFSLAFAEAPQPFSSAFAVCQHHYPQNFWSEAAQVHPNGARRLRSMVFVAPDPVSFVPFLEAWTNHPVDVHADGSVVIRMASAEIEVLDAGTLQRRYAVAVAAEAAQLVGLRFACASSGQVRGCLNAGRLSYSQIGDTLVVAPETALGASLIFEPEDMP